GAVAGQATGAEDDVSAAVDHLLRRAAALGWVGERRRVDEVDLDVRLHRLRTVDVALDEALDRRDDDEAADDTDVIALRERRREDAGHVARLVLGEEQRLAVLRRPRLVVPLAGDTVDGDE